MKFSVNVTNEIIIIFPNAEKTSFWNSDRVKVWSRNASITDPVIVVVKQESEVVSWQIPFRVLTSKKNQTIYFTNVSRTLCPTHIKRINNVESEYDNLNFMADIERHPIITLSTSSLTDVEVNVFVDQEIDFYLKSNRTYYATVSPSNPKYYYYEFPDNKHKLDVVSIEVNTSPENVCLTVSFQDPECPVFDLNKDVTYRGKYQTINSKGGMKLARHTFPNGFFLVVVAKGDNYECTQGLFPDSVDPSAVVSDDRITAMINFTIMENKHSTSFSYIIFVPVLIVFGIAVAVFLFFHHALCGTIPQKNNELDSRRNGDTTMSNQEESFALIGTSSTDHDVAVNRRCEEDRAEDANLTEQSENQPGYDEVTKHRLQKSFNYLYHILNVGVFYFLPVLQLAVVYWRTLERTGDENMCYYNFLCANPAFGFADFNHVISNIGYIVLGLTFMGMIWHRSRVLEQHNREGKRDAYGDEKPLGIPQNYGIFYAMGIALTMEGFLSACYHVCPNYSNFQFDTTFMYTMVVLCIVKLYKNRHPDSYATAYATFTVIACLLIFWVALDSLFPSKYVWITFPIFYIVLCVYVSGKVIERNQFGANTNNQSDRVTLLGSAQENENETIKCYNTFGDTDQQSASISNINCLSSEAEPLIHQPSTSQRDCEGSWCNDGNAKNENESIKFKQNVIVGAIVLQVIILVIGLILHFTKAFFEDFGTFLLFLLIINGSFYVGLYSLMKKKCKESICKEAILSGVFAMLFWVPAAGFFCFSTSKWTKTPAESRQINKNCIFLDFYDTHDVWHLLSAPALFCSFMYLVHLDDDLLNKKRDEIAFMVFRGRDGNNVQHNSQGENDDLS